MIEVRGLARRYGDVTAVDDLTFDVTPGSVTGFLGPNGAGKTTTMRMILGLDAPSAGQARVLGSRFADLPAPMRAVGALLDAGAVHPRRTARDHLRCLALAGRLSPRRVDEVLDLVGLTDVAHRRAGGFSLGMSQRLGLAAALLGDPEVLLLDEPVNGLDPEGIVWIRTLMRRLAAEGRTLLVSSHLMAEMALTADRLIVVARGRLVADTTVEAFARPEGVLVRTPDARAFARTLVAYGASAVRHDGGAGEELIVSGVSAREIGRLAAAEGVVLHELTPRRASLEEAFMELTREVTAYESAGAAR
ncbi:ABC transporter ATP-binding protein [Sphaerisporangium sp. NPDC051011]|uniref:ABC transporter ATP-binding protein n=1 Tax=Sphaerisporangium sp. NPDC051011 TaxID=3155792 RepID=UPI0033D4F56F